MTIPEAELKPKAITKPARDAILRYIKGGETRFGRGSRIRLAYLIDPDTKRITETYLKNPHHTNISRLIMSDKVTWEQHRLPEAGQTYICVDQAPFLTVNASPRNSFTVDQPRLKLIILGRGVLISIGMNGSTQHCQVGHNWLLKTFRFFDDNTKLYQPASFFNQKVFRP